MNILRALPAALLILVMSLSALAQSTRPARDPRPLGRVDVSDIPHHVFGAATNGSTRKGSIADGAVRVGTLSLTPLRGTTNDLGTLRFGDLNQLLGVNVTRGANGT